MANKGAEADLKGLNESQTKKREDCLTWSDYFMGLAMLSAMRSKDPNTQVGACIVNEEKRIVGIGYNGMPNDCSDTEFPWGKDSKTRSETKDMYVCHAAMNAILNKNCCKLNGCQIYMTHFPCNECAKMIVQSGIKEVYYLSDKNIHMDEGVGSQIMFSATDVKYEQYQPATNDILIDFTNP